MFNKYQNSKIRSSELVIGDWVGGEASLVWRIVQVSSVLLMCPKQRRWDKVWQ